MLLRITPTWCARRSCYVQRDNGDRKNRKHARLKYTMDDMGNEVFKSKVRELLNPIEASNSRHHVRLNSHPTLTRLAGRRTKRG